MVLRWMKTDCAKPRCIRDVGSWEWIRNSITNDAHIKTIDIEYPVKNVKHKHLLAIKYPLHMLDIIKTNELQSFDVFMIYSNVSRIRQAQSLLFAIPFYLWCMFAMNFDLSLLLFNLQPTLSRISEQIDCVHAVGLQSYNSRSATANQTFCKSPQKLLDWFEFKLT